MTNSTDTTVEMLARVTSLELPPDWAPSLDEAIESGAFDPDFGPPEFWPRWVDEDRWEPTAPDAVVDSEHWMVGDEPYEPTDEDWSWLDDMYERDCLEQQWGTRMRFV